MENQKKITISDLEKYHHDHSLPKKGRKNKKVKTIMCHMLRDRNVGRDKREAISGDEYDEHENEEGSNSADETAIILALLDSDKERKDSDIKNSDCVEITRKLLMRKLLLYQ